MKLLTALAAALLPSALAVFQDEAYKVDFHHALLGLPEASNTLFHPPYPGTKASLVYTLSEQGVLGAVNPRNGTIVWRQQLECSADKARLLRVADGQGTLITSCNDDISVWSTADGRLDWDMEFRSDAVKDVQILNHATAEHTKDIIALLSGAPTTVLRLDGATGHEKWRYSDQSDTPLQLAISKTAIHYVSLSAGMLKGYKIKVTELDRETGESRDQLTLSSEASSPSDVIFVGQASAPIVLWTDSKRSSLKINIVGQKDVRSFDIKTTSKPVDQVRVHASEKPDAAPHFLVHYETVDEHWAEVFHVDGSKDSVTHAYDLPKLAGPGAFSASAVDADVYFTRIAAGETTLTSSVSHGRLSRFPIGKFEVPGIAAGEILSPVHASSDVVVRADGTYAIRSATLLSSGDWILIRNGKIDWIRHESLANVLEAGYGELQLPDNIPVRDLELEERADPVSAFLHRIKRHVQDSGYLAGFAKDLPDLVITWLDNFVTPGAGADLKYQGFGFKKLVIVRTVNGRLVALQHGDQGRVVFNIADAPNSNPLHVRVNALGASDARWTDLLPNGARVVMYQPTPMPSVVAGSDADLVGEVSYGIKDGYARGYQRAARQGHVDLELWTFSVSPGQKIIAISGRLPDEPVASIGKALGDRRVLYKYLNPNVVVVTATNEAQQSVSFYLLDAISGIVLHSAHHPNVDTSRPINAVVSENWLAYSFTSHPIEINESHPNGVQFFMSELYESPLPNDRGPLGPKATNFSTTEPASSSAAYLPHVISQAFIIPEEITAMAVTQTGQGITSRQILVSTAFTKGIVAIPRHVFDPRRPVGKDPTAPQAMEEGLIRYAPFVDLDPNLFLSHSREVVGIKKIMTTPSAMESTSLVLAYGLDIFGTRVAPSFTFDILGASFNKVQLGMTVVCLVAATVGVAPLVKKKMVNQLWTSQS